MGYASGKHRKALFATGVILFVIIMILNLAATATSQAARAMKRLIHPDLAQRIIKALLILVTALTLAILLFIITYLLLKGLPVFSLEFFTGHAIDMGRAGGIFPFIVSTVFLSVVALAIATPLGVGTAIYLTEYTREGRLTRIIRFGAECLAGVPSIIFGLFGFVFFVIYLHLGWSISPAG